jgi:hypothetical protein
MNDKIDKELEDELAKLEEDTNDKPNPEGGPSYGDLFIEDSKGLPSLPSNEYEIDVLKNDIHDYLLSVKDRVAYKDLIQKFGPQAKQKIKELLLERKVTQYNNRKKSNSV